MTGATQSDRKNLALRVALRGHPFMDISSWILGDILWTFPHGLHAATPSWQWPWPGTVSYLGAFVGGAFGQRIHPKTSLGST